MERFFYYNHAEQGHNTQQPRPEQDTAIQKRYEIYPHLAKLIHPEDATQQSILELREVFAAISKDSDGDKQLDVLDELLSQHRMNDLYSHLRSLWGVDQQELSTFITTKERFPTFTEALLPHQETYRFPLAVLLSHYTTATLPISWQQHLRSRFVSENMRSSITERIPEWNLCGSSEQYLIRAIDDSAVTDVNGFMLVKHVGRLAGLCVINATTPEGTFARGNWYAPIEKDLRQGIRDAHDTGIGHLRVSSGTWTLMRGLTEYAGIDASDIVNQAEDCLISLPNNLPDRINGYTRAKYRVGHEEAF